MADIPSMIKELEQMQAMKEFILEEYEYLKEISKYRPLSVSEISKIELLEHLVGFSDGKS